MLARLGVQRAGKRALGLTARGFGGSRVVRNQPPEDAGGKLSGSGSGSSGSSGGGAARGHGPAADGGDKAAQVQHAKDSAAKAAETVARYSQQYANAYGDLERTLMERIKESSSRRFRLTLLSVIVVVAWVIAVFGKMIRKALSDQTAGLALETLENESLKVQTEELAMAVVQTVLNDKEVTAHAATFLHEAASVPETQQALLKLTLHVLQHPDTLKEVAVLVKKLVVQLSADKDTLESLGTLLANVLREPQVQRAAAQLVMELARDPEVVAMATELTLAVLEKPEVGNATGNILTGVGTQILSDQEVVAQSRDFVVEVMGDELIQREGGDALWNSIKHALRPGVRGFVGLGVVAVSIGLIKVMLSPF